MPALSRRTLRELLNWLCQGHEQGVRPARYEAIVAEIDRALGVKRHVVAARKRKAKKDAGAKAEWASIRAAVLERSQSGMGTWRCEACDLRTLHPQVDHVFGGNGRRRSLQSVFTCWCLCDSCHRAKTRNAPDAAHWLEAFVEHCQRREGLELFDGMRRGYQEAARIAQARLDSLCIQGRSEGQAP